MLTALAIPFKTLLKGNETQFYYKEHEIRITSLGKLITYPKAEEMPLGLPLDAIKEKGHLRLEGWEGKFLWLRA